MSLPPGNNTINLSCEFFVFFFSGVDFSRETLKVLVYKFKEFDLLLLTNQMRILRGRTIIFLERGMKNIENNCLQGLKRQNKLFANVIG